MSNQLDKVIKKFNFKGLKLNMCTKKSFDKKRDYEFVPYDQPLEKSKQTKKGQVEQVAPIQNEANFSNNIMVFKSIYSNLSNANLLNNLENLKHSNKIEQEEIPFYENNIFSNDDYDSPFQSSFVSQSTSKCSCYNDCSSCADCEKNETNSENLSQDNNESYFDIDNERLYVCCKAFKAKMDGDLSLRFTDRIKLIHQNNDIALVKNILNGKCGYVPRDCITTISEFLSEIQYFN